MMEAVIQPCNNVDLGPFITHLAIHLFYFDVNNNHGLTKTTKVKSLGIPPLTTMQILRKLRHN